VASRRVTRRETARKVMRRFIGGVCRVGRRTELWRDDEVISLRVDAQVVIGRQGHDVVVV
jgi:hypothetical protein